MVGINISKKFKIARLQRLFEDAGLHMGQMISGSKTLYHRMNPNNLVCFNGNIFVKGLGKVWWGDVDVTRSKTILRKIAYDNQITLYVLREMDGRFDNENRPDEELDAAAAAVFKPLSKQIKIEFEFEY